MATLITVTSFQVFYLFWCQKIKLLTLVMQIEARTLKTPKVRRKQYMGFIHQKQEGKHLVRMGSFGKNILNKSIQLETISRIIILNVWG